MAYRAVTRHHIIQTIERVLPLARVSVNVGVRVDVHPRDLAEHEQIINYERMRCGSLRTVHVGYPLTRPPRGRANDGLQLLRLL